jgi:hypothetical protein
LYAKQKTPAKREKRAVTSAVCQPYLGGRCWRELMWIVILIAAPQDRFFLDGQGGRHANRKGLRQTMPCSDQTGRCRREYGLMQCSLGSRSGTWGVEVCGASRSWADGTIPLASWVAGGSLWRLQASSHRPPITPHITPHQRSSPTSACMIPKPSSVSFLRNNWLASSL